MGVNICQSYSKFVDVLREMMQRSDVTQADIARTLEVSEQYVSDVMHGRRLPFQLNELTRLSSVYGFDRGELLTARAWTVRRVDLEPQVSYKEVEEIVERLLKRGTER